MARWWNRRRAPDPLGTGVWCRADGRFRRAVGRYHQVLERVEAVTFEVDKTGEGPSEPGAFVQCDLGVLRTIGGDLAALLPRVRATCVSAQVLVPSESEDIPAGPGGLLLDVHRGVARAATVVAQAAQSLTMVLVAVQGERVAEAAAATLGARHAAAQAEVHVRRAESILESVASVVD
jgi:hypothetical protein